MGKLSTATRNRLSRGSFALLGRRYPIEDRSHAANAPARVSQYGSPSEKATVRARVHRRFPMMGKKKGRLRSRLAGMRRAGAFGKG